MSCATVPVFWQRQNRLPLPTMRFFRMRLDAALDDPLQRGQLVWPMILGSPRQRDLHPDGVPEAELIVQAARILNALGINDPRRVWAEHLERCPDTARQGDTGWLPGETWEAFAPEVSLRAGVTLVALTGASAGVRYRMECAVALFNMALFHETHDALEAPWLNAEGALKEGLQGLILLTAGFYHQQHHDAAGMQALWRDGLSKLEPFEGRLRTPGGTVGFDDCLESVRARYDWLTTGVDHSDLGRLWEMPRPEWSLT